MPNKPPATHIESTLIVSQVMHECESCNWVDKTDGYHLIWSDMNVRVVGTIASTVTLPVLELTRGQTMRVSHGLSKNKNVTVVVEGGLLIGNSTNDTSEVIGSYGSVSTFRWNGTGWWVIAR